MHTYLEGSHAELNTEAQINVEVVGQKIEEHVVGAKQRDEEKGGLSQAPVGQKGREWWGCFMLQNILICERNLGYRDLNLHSVCVSSGKAGVTAVKAAGLVSGH